MLANIIPYCRTGVKKPNVYPRYCMVRRFTRFYLICINIEKKLWYDYPQDGHPKRVNYKHLQVVLRPSIVATYPHTTTSCKRPQNKKK